MAEQGLHVADVGAGVQAMIREVVPEPVGTRAAQIRRITRIARLEFGVGPCENLLE